MTESASSRRNILRGLGAIAVLPATAGVAYSASSVLFAKSDIAARLAKILRHRESAAALGWAISEFGKSVSDIATLQQEFNNRWLGWQQGLQEHSDDEIRTTLVQSVRQDFERGHVVSVNGWRLSETEAAIAVLVSQHINDLPQHHNGEAS